MRTDRTAASLLALALGAGVTDATSYLGLGHVFTANMTGNTVLVAVAAVQGHGGDVARSSTALGGFCLGVAAGTALIPRGRRGWPRLAARAFALEAVALAALLAGWALAGAPALRWALIALAAGAMGVQSAAVRASDVRGVNTTYMTSTLQNAIARLVRRSQAHPAREQAPGLPGAAWLTYGVGALLGALLTRSWGPAGLGVPLAVLCVVTATGTRHKPGKE